MKQILKYTTACISMLLFSVVFVSCEEDNPNSDLSSTIYPKSIEMTLPESLQQLMYVEDGTLATVLPLIKGETVSLGFTIAPENVTDKNVQWTSSNESVATVDTDGKLTAVSGDGTGYAIVQVAPEVFYSGSNIFSTLKVVVANSVIVAESIEVTSDVEEVFAGESIQLKASILPENATYKTVNWTSSNEAVATVDMNGVVTGIANESIATVVTITATSLDGASVIGTKEITVKQIIEPEEVSIDQTYSVDKDYLHAIADKTIKLSYTTVPAVVTQSLIEWSSSDETIATVAGGVVTINQEGVFGDVVITAKCPETENSSSIKLRIEEGLVRELYHNKDNYSWYNAAQSGNGTSSSHVWSYGKVTVTTYTQNATKQRGDFKCWSPKTWLHAGKYPIIAIRMDDLMDMDAVTARNITLDASGSAGGSAYSGGLNGNNNKWLHDYKCSDGSHVFIFDMSTQGWATGGVLPANELATFNTIQFKYADIATLTEQVQYNVYWVQTFKTIDDLENYVESEGLTYEIIK